MAKLKKSGRQDIIHVLTVILNSNAEFSFDEDTDLFETIESAIQAEGVLKVDGDLKTIEDLLEEAKEEEMKTLKDEEAEDMWAYEPLDCLLTQEKFIIRSRKTLELARQAVETEKL